MTTKGVDRNKIEFLEEFYEMLSKEVIIAYQGTFEKSVLSVLANNIETTIESNLVLRKKFFKIFLELAQNISEHSIDKQTDPEGQASGSGLLILKHFENNYMFLSGNIIKSDEFHFISEIVNQINSMDRENLRHFKREQYRLAEEGKESNLGMAKMALISGNNIEVNTIKIDDKSDFIIFSVVVPNLD